MAGSLLDRRDREADIDRELAFHIDQQIADYVAAGMPRDEATRRTRLEFGGFQQVREDCRDVFVVRWWDDLVRDVRLVIRGFRKTPVFFVVSVATLALCIGSNAAMFSLVNSLLLKPLPVSRPDQLVVLSNGYAGRASYYWNKPLWDEIRRRPELFDGTAAWSSTQLDLSTGGRTGSR